MPDQNAVSSVSTQGSHLEQDTEVNVIELHTHNPKSLQDLRKTIFQRGSKTYFNSSLFFPKKVRERVFTLYAFVRKADDFVDTLPQDGQGFYAFRTAYQKALQGNPSNDPIIDPFVALSRECGFDPSWTEAFLGAMEADLYKQTYETLEETLHYMYGSAEVVGLFMSRILELPEESYAPARILGRAMQYINFCRDIAEDYSLGRRYLPLEGFDARIVEESYARLHPEEFSLFLRTHLKRYRVWQQEAIAGYQFIPDRYLIPIRTAADMYFWTADQIERNPLIVFDRKVKPSRLRIFLRILRNVVLGWVEV
ncbi:MAG: phytoene/squalene synthase family protein [Spirochaetes bacterium]|nr:phytoene/squalene synthase family protein [Spirochaetota bacterium]